MRQVYFFDEKELELLRKELPYENPCTEECRKKTYCNGHCIREEVRDKFEKSVEPYRNAGLYDVAIQLKNAYVKQREIERMKKELQKLERDLADVKSLYPQLFEDNKEKIGKKVDSDIKTKSSKKLKARCRETFSVPSLYGFTIFSRGQEYEVNVEGDVYTVIHSSKRTLELLSDIFNNYFELIN